MGTLVGYLRQPKMVRVCLAPAPLRPHRPLSVGLWTRPGDLQVAWCVTLREWPVPCVWRVTPPFFVSCFPGFAGSRSPHYQQSGILCTLYIVNRAGGLVYNKV
jgi:hypothetical protein